MTYFTAVCFRSTDVGYMSAESITGQISLVCVCFLIKYCTNCDLSEVIVATAPIVHKLRLRVYSTTRKKDIGFESNK